jgi:hypothetical protein
MTLRDMFIAVSSYPAFCAGGQALLSSMTKTKAKTTTKTV